MKIRELRRKLEDVEEKHGNIFVGLPTVDRGHYTRVVDAQVNKNKGEWLDEYPIVEFDGQAILVIR